MKRRHINPYTQHRKQYNPPEDSYATNSYVMNEVDRAFLTTLFTHGGAVHVCETEMKAKYFAMRIRCIIYKKDKELLKAVKMAVRGNDVVSWTTDVYPSHKCTEAMHERFKDMGWVTYYSQPRSEPLTLDLKKKALLHRDSDEEAPASMESEEEIRKYIESMKGGSEDG